MSFAEDEDDDGGGGGFAGEEEEDDDNEESTFGSSSTRVSRVASASSRTSGSSNAIDSNNGAGNGGDSSNSNSQSSSSGISGSGSKPSSYSRSGGGVGGVPNPNNIDLSLCPSMRGVMRQEGKAVVCKGLWALSDAGHNVSGQTSDFEFSLVEPFPGVSFPPSGKYAGYFMLKQPYSKSKKYEDRNMVLNFSSSDGGIEYSIDGEGQNDFGLYFLRGSFSLNNLSVHIYREYKPIEINTLPAAKPAPAPKAPKSNPSSFAAAAPAVAVSSSGRVRKVKKFDYEDDGEEDDAFGEDDGEDDFGSKRAPRKASSKAASAAATVHRSGPVKLDSSMQKCMTVLKDISSLKNAFYFLEPVDPIRLNIPDYPRIIAHPMDLRTVRENLEAGFYDTPAAFADHMRLIFANAIKFNYQKEHVVNAAARDIQGRFEDKFRKMYDSAGKESKAKSIVSKFNKYDDDLEEEVYHDDLEDDDDDDFVGLGKRPKSKASSSTKPSRAASYAQAAPPPPSRGLSGPSSGLSRSNSYSSIDPKDALLNELARKMQQMEAEVVHLRTQLSKQEVKTQLEKQKEAAQSPLSIDEKQDLIAAIGQLSEERLEWVIETVRASLPPHKRNDEEIEIEIDILDTLTLRKLQDYIASGDSRPVKKPKKETKKQQQQQHMYQQQQQQQAAPQRPTLPPNPRMINNSNNQYNQQHDDMLGGDDALFQFEPDEEEEFGSDDRKPAGMPDRSMSSNAMNLAREREKEQAKELALERQRQQQEAMREEERKKREAMLKSQKIGMDDDDDDEEDVNLF